MIAAIRLATRTIGIVAGSRAQAAGARSHRTTGLTFGASRSARGGPSSLVIRLKIANIDASQGSRASKARSMLFRSDC